MGNKKKGKNLIKCPMFIAMCITMFGVSLYGFAETFYGEYQFHMTWDRPAFVSVVLGEKDEIVYLEPDEYEIELAKIAEDIMAEEIVSETPTEEIEKPEEVTQEPEIIEEEPDGSNEVVREDGSITIVPANFTTFEEWNNNPPRGRFYTNPGIRPLSSKYDYKQVDIDYFSNSLFIGDSRIEGLSYYGGIDTATFIYKTGMSVFKLLESDLKLKEGPDVSPDTIRIEDYLQTRQFENIYIMLGINELGSGTPSFGRKYIEILGRIRELQPNARIIIMGIMFVTNDYEKNPDVFNNDNVNSKNVYLSRYANGKTIFYLDMNPSVIDENNGLTKEYTFDGVHLSAQYYALWTQFMCEHGY